MVEYAKKTGTDRIELYTEKFAKMYESGDESSIESYAACSRLANDLKIGVNAGHDLSLKNIEFLYRRLDQNSWKFCNKGFFNFKKYIPKIVEDLKN